MRKLSSDYYVSKYLNPQRFESLICFFLKEEKFTYLAGEHDLGWILAKDERLRERFDTGKFKYNFFEKKLTAIERRKEVLVSLCDSFAKVLLCFVVAIIAASTGGFQLKLEDISPQDSLQALAAGILLWMTLWEIRETKSWGGESLPERVRKWVFDSCFCLGTFLLFFSALI